MRAYTSGVRMVDGLLGARLCLLAVFVFVCSIDRSNSNAFTNGTAANNTIEEPIRHRNSSLTVAQRKSAVTIEFDFKHIDRTNRTAVRIAYLETRRKILDRLNRRRRSTSSPTNSTIVAADTTIVATATTIATTAATTSDVITTATPTATSTITTLASTTVTNPTTIVTTIPTEPTTTTAALETTQTTLAVESTTETPTTVSTTTTAGEPLPERKRKRRSNGGNNNNSTLSDDDLSFIDNGFEIDENGTLIISFFINSTEFSDDVDLLFKVLKELRTEDGFKDIANVTDIYQGLPKKAMAMADIRANVTDIYKGLPTSKEAMAMADIRANVTDIYKGLSTSKEAMAMADIRGNVTDIYKELPPPKEAMAMADIRVWLPILFAIIILIIIFIVVFCCWKATNKKVRYVEHQKIVPKQDSKPSPSNSRSAHPRILDDNSGWLVPYEQFYSEQK